MAITHVDVFQVEWPAPEKARQGTDGRSAWLRITDDSGHEGLGEATPMLGGLASATIIRHHLASLLIGADPLDAAVLHERMFHHAVKIGPDGALAGALAAIDIALWDLKGRILGCPIYKLLGGAWRRTLPHYGSIGGIRPRSVDQVLRLVEQRLEHKPALIKIRADAYRTERDIDVEGDLAKAKAVRKLVGDSFPLAFDANNSYSVGASIRVGRELEQLGYRWFEEPVQHYHVQAMGEVARRLDIAVSAGEQTYTLQGLADLINAGVRIIQPDIVKMGGFTGMMQAQALAHAHGCDLVPHMTQPSIGNTANLHFVASQLHGWAPAELDDPSELQLRLFKRIPRRVDGIYHLDDAPGLGLELDEQALAPLRRDLPV